MADFDPLPEHFLVGLTRGDLDAAVQTLRGDIAAIASLNDAVAAIRADVDALQKSSVNVEALREDIAKMQLAVTKIEEFVNGDPPLQDRLIALEENVARFKEATGISEAEIVREAGSAGDPAHRETIRDESGKLIGISEEKQERVNEGFRSRISDLFGITGGLQSASIRLFGILALAGAVLLYVISKVIVG